MSFYFFSVRERAEFDKSCNRIVLGRSGRNFPSGPLMAGGIVVNYFRNDLAVIAHSLPFYISIDESSTQVYLYILLNGPESVCK